MRTKQPRFLNEVMDAIAVLKDSKGSPAKKVIERVEKTISNVAKIRNPVGQIQKAIVYGVDNGLITQNGGNFKLGLNNKEYQLFKDFKSMSGDGLFREHRRRRGRSRRRRRRRSRRGRRGGRRKSNEMKSVQLGLVPEDRGRRRRRRRRRGRRGGRRRGHELGTRSFEKMTKMSMNKDAESVVPAKTFVRSANERVERSEAAGRGFFGSGNYSDSSKSHPCCGNPGFQCERPENRHPPCYNNCQENCNCHHNNMY